MRAAFAIAACLIASLLAHGAPAQIMRKGEAPPPVIEAIETRFATGEELDAEIGALLASETDEQGRPRFTLLPRLIAIFVAADEAWQPAAACARLAPLMRAYREKIAQLTPEDVGNGPEATGNFFSYLGRMVQLGRVGAEACRPLPDSMAMVAAVEADKIWARDEIARTAAILAVRRLRPIDRLIAELGLIGSQFLKAHIDDIMPRGFARSLTRSTGTQIVNVGHAPEFIPDVEVARTFASVRVDLLALLPAETLSVDVAGSPLLDLMTHDAILGRAAEVNRNAERLRSIVRRDSAGEGSERGLWECPISTLQLLAQQEPAARPSPPRACRNSDYGYRYQEIAGRVFYIRLLTLGGAERSRSLLPLLINQIIGYLAAGQPEVADPLGEGADIVTRLRDAERGARADNDTPASRFRMFEATTAGSTSYAIFSAAMEDIAAQRGAGPLYREYRTLRDRLDNSSGLPPSPTPPGFEDSGLRQVGGASNLIFPEELPGLRRQLEALRLRLVRQVPEFAEWSSGAPVRLEQIQHALRPDELMLLVATTPFGTHMLAISSTDVRAGVSDWGMARVQRAVDRLRWDLGADVVPFPSNTYSRWMDQSEGGRAFSRSLAHDIYRETIGPVETMLMGKKRLIVVASGPLATLPFSVLVTEPPQGSDASPADLRATAWLADGPAITQLDSLMSFRLIRQRPAGQVPDGHQFSFLGIGDPVTYGEDLGCIHDRGTARRVAGQLRSAAQQITNPHVLIRALPRIRCTATELQNMAQMLQAPQSVLIQAEEATEARIRETDMSSADIIHFATHGLVGDFAGTRVTESALILTPPPNDQDPPWDKDGFLLSSDIAELRLRAQLVILSACNSGQGDDVDAAPLSGLARAFLNAGARSLMVSYWPVSDSVGPLLTVETVRLLRESNGRLTAAEALQMAMRSVRNNRSMDGPNGSFAHPHYWASFSVIGD